MRYAWVLRLGGHDSARSFAEATRRALASVAARPAAPTRWERLVVALLRSASVRAHEGWAVVEGELPATLLVALLSR